MRTRHTVLMALWCLSSLAGKPIPDRWKNNPYLGRVYILKDDVSPLKSGDKVAISIRSVEDCLFRSKPNETLGLLLVGGKNQDDPGVIDVLVPYSDIPKLLELTEEKAPLTHWQKHYSKEADGHIPNLKPNFWHSTNFPITVYLAAKQKKERPRLIMYGDVWRLIQPSPYCTKDEFTVRLQEPEGRSKKSRNEEKQKVLPYVLADWEFGSDYCINIRELLAEGPNQHAIVDPKLPDQIDWDNFVVAYHVSFDAVNKKTLRVSPFSEADKASGRTGPSIRVTKTTEGTWIAEYDGPLYYACAGGVCRVQSYKIELDDKGTLVQFKKNGLYYWNGQDELLLEKVDLERLLWIANNKDQLGKVYEWAKSDSNESYSASMSKLSEIKSPRRAGNSFGTFVIHLSKIREAIGAATLWPIYDGASPGMKDTMELRLK